MIAWDVALFLTFLAGAPEKASQESLTASHPWIGRPAPPIELSSVSGEKVSLAAFKGRKLVVIHFAASW